MHPTHRSLALAALLLPALASLSAFAGCGGGDADNHATTSGTTSGSGGDHTGGQAGTGGQPGDAGSDANTPPPPGIAFFTGSAIDLTPDGSIALVEDLNTADVYFYDTITGDLQLQTNAGSPENDLVTGISATLHVSANYAVPVVSGVWSEANDWMDVSDIYTDGCDVFRGGAFDISADGKVAVGLVWHGCYPEAFRWTDTGGKGTLTVLQILGSSDPSTSHPPANRASKVSDDGQVAAGFAENFPLDRSPAIWTADGKGFLLDPTKTDAPGEVLSISADGSMVAGVWGDDGFSWTKDKGIVVLPRPPGSMANDRMFPNAIAAGGKLVFGGSGDPFFTTPIAFVITPTGEALALQDVATQNGIAIPAGTLLTNVMAASADGSVLVGSALDANGKPTGFVLRLPVSAYGITSP